MSIQWPPEHDTRPWGEVEVPGFSFVLVDKPRRPYGVAKRGRQIMGKAEAFSAVHQAAPELSAQELARLSMFLLDTGVANRLPYYSRQDSEGFIGVEVAQTPNLEGKTLTYWRHHIQMNVMVRCTVDLSTSALNCLSAEDLETRGRELEAAKEKLNSDNYVDRWHAVSLLERDGSGSAVDLLSEIAASHSDYSTRERAVQSLSRVGGASAGTVLVLVTVLESDAHAKVRLAAAQGLGELGGPEAVAALKEAARTDEDRIVQTVSAGLAAQADR